MERFLMTDLKAWKENKRRKPLILWGARQVGKTWLMKEFGKRYYRNTVYISFYNNRRMAELFESDYDAERIVEAIELIEHVKIEPGNTLIIFDEVQEAPKVVESLKYFCEEAPEYHIVAAGSLLGVALHKDISFPVGKVNELRLFPMNFREFMQAMGEKKLLDYLEDITDTKVKDFANEYRELLKIYMCVGGMPEVVAAYVEDRDLKEVRQLQNDIISQYEGDFGKHAGPAELTRIRMVWQSVPLQLAKENKKFFFGQIKEGARSKEYETAIQWLADAGLIYKVNKVTKPAVPLKSYVDMSAFKLFILDIGLLGAMSELDTNTILEGNDIFVEFKGAFAEQYVLQQLMSDSDYTLYYYSGDKSTYEVDFLLQKGKNIVPVEVKAETNLKSKSLKIFCDKFCPSEAVRISASDYVDQGWMRNIPLWGVSRL
ncbi:MAG: ATP-binding protein [Clostridiales bacterium]|nr:ATP-binding protein [Clostridiales bacterium]